MVFLENIALFHPLLVSALSTDGDGDKTSSFPDFVHPCFPRFRYRMGGGLGEALIRNLVF